VSGLSLGGGFSNGGTLPIPPINGGTGISQPTFSGTMAQWFASLPTTLPGTSGQPWNNGGMLSFS